MKKAFVLRVSTLMSSVDTPLRFGSDNEVVIPMAVVDELQIYEGKPEKKKIANGILHYLESFDIKKLTTCGVKQSNGSILKIATNYHDVEVSVGNLSETDKRVFQVCLGMMKNEPNKKVILVSKNAAIRIKAATLDILAEDFKDDLFPVLSEQYTARQTVFVKSEEINHFYKEGFIELSKVHGYEKIEWTLNMFVEVQEIGGQHKVIGRYDGTRIVDLSIEPAQYPYGIMAKNSGQKMLIECLMKDWKEVPLVIVKGDAGTGKTYCSLAAALQGYDDNVYERILVATPTETVGNEKLGFLPGDIEKKVSPYLGGIKDNLSQLINGKKKKKKDEPRENGEYLFERGILEVQPIGFLRGRTIVNTIFIIDETQNVDPGDIKSIVTRSAEGSKFIFLGDPTQVDNPKLNERYNGLVYISEKMKGDPLCMQVSFNPTENVRSELSKRASQIL